MKNNKYRFRAKVRKDGGFAAPDFVKNGYDMSNIDLLTFTVYGVEFSTKIHGGYKCVIPMRVRKALHIGRDEEAEFEFLNAVEVNKIGGK